MIMRVIMRMTVGGQDRREIIIEPADGRLFRLDTGTISTLGTEHDEPVISTWNVPAR